MLHYSEHAHIPIFNPHIPATNPTSRPVVWAIEAKYAPLYWFPRDCPRVTIWVNDESQEHLLEEQFDTRSARVHFARTQDEGLIRATTLFEYSFTADPFEAWPDAEGQWISTTTVRPISQRPLGDLVTEHHNGGVDLRWVDDLGAARDDVIASGLPFSIVRLPWSA